MAIVYVLLKPDQKFGMEVVHKNAYALHVEHYLLVNNNKYGNDV
jgi:hypothetical protein